MSSIWLIVGMSATAGATWALVLSEFVSPSILVNYCTTLSLVFTTWSFFKYRWSSRALDYDDSWSDESNDDEDDLPYLDRQTESPLISETSTDNEAESETDDSLVDRLSEDDLVDDEGSSTQEYSGETDTSPCPDGLVDQISRFMGWPIEETLRFMEDHQLFESEGQPFEVTTWDNVTIARSELNEVTFTRKYPVPVTEHPLADNSLTIPVETKSEDEVLITEEHVDIILTQHPEVSRSEAIQCLINHNGDVLGALLAISGGSALESPSE